MSDWMKGSKEHLCGSQLEKISLFSQCWHFSLMFRSFRGYK
jgi:hypothetical protein